MPRRIAADLASLIVIRLLTWIWNPESTSDLRVKSDRARGETETLREVKLKWSSSDEGVFGAKCMALHSCLSVIPTTQSSLVRNASELKFYIFETDQGT